jgi:prolyl 4-hydroxylase
MNRDADFKCIDRFNFAHCDALVYTNEHKMGNRTHKAGLNGKIYMTLKMPVLSTDPYIEMMDDFLTPDECNHFIQIADGKLNRALVSSDNGGVFSGGRTGSNCWITHAHDEVVGDVCRRIADYVKMPLKNAESVQVVYYGSSQEYGRHYDGWKFIDTEKNRRCLSRGGQRLMTCLVYLNEPVRGGTTDFTRLGISVTPKIGRLVIFHNVHEGTNELHENSEHAGMPVLEGEKYAFNLWFRQQDFNTPFTYTVNKSAQMNLEEHAKESTIATAAITHSTEYDDVVHNSRPHIIESHDVFSSNDLQFIQKWVEAKTPSSQTAERKIWWVPKDQVPGVVNNLTKRFGFPINCMENISITEYKAGTEHRMHYDAYDCESEKGRSYMAQLGQRIVSVVGFFESGASLSYFTNPPINVVGEKGMCVVCWNTESPASQVRLMGAQSSFSKFAKDTLIMNIWIRQKAKDGSPFIGPSPSSTNTNNPPITVQPTKTHCVRTYEEYKTMWRSEKGYGIVVDDLEELDEWRTQHGGSLLNRELERVETGFSEFEPKLFPQIVEQPVLEIIRRAANKMIDANLFEFGDRQAKRFRGRDDVLSRMIHIEFLPVMERIVGKSLKPTYTYMSGYVADADLPPHTDNPDCEYTVSFLIERDPEDVGWSVYFDKTKQPVKHKGRYTEYPPDDSCVSSECNVGDAVMFSGTDHIHFRKAYTGNKYYVLLLHYCVVNE